MYKRILVPLDGSSLSESILPHAVSFAEALGASMELLHVMDTEGLRAVSEREHETPANVVEERLRAATMEYLQKVAKNLSKRISVGQSVEIGTAAKAILERAAERSGTLVAMATRGHSGVKRWFLGSVAQKVLQATQTPLLLIKANAERETREEPSYRRLLVPLDGSGLAEQILPHARTIARAMNLGVELLRVYSLPVGVLGPVVYPANAELNTAQTLRDDVENYLEGKVLQLRDGAGLKRVSSVALQGEAAERIIETARQTANSLIAMCTHGRSGMERWMLGSVADRVVRHAGDPVIIVRPSADAHT